MSGPPFMGPGFFAEPITIATEGRVETTLAYDVDLTPRPPRPITVQERSDASLGRVHGIDLDFASGDFEVDANGDLRLTRGLEGLRQAFSRAIFTAPAELFWRGQYGIGATEFLNRAASLENIHELRNRIRESLAGHVAVDELKPIDVVLEDGGALLNVHTVVVIAGREQQVGAKIGSV